MHLKKKKQILQKKRNNRDLKHGEEFVRRFAKEIIALIKIKNYRVKISSAFEKKNEVYFVIFKSKYAEFLDLQNTRCMNGDDLQAGLLWRRQWWDESW